MMQYEHNEYDVVCTQIKYDVCTQFKYDVVCTQLEYDVVCTQLKYDVVCTQLRPSAKQDTDFSAEFA